jgi:transposase
MFGNYNDNGMAFLATHKNKKNGAEYVYEVHSYWDKKKKVHRNKQKYLGRLNKVTGEIIPAKKRTPSIQQSTKIQKFKENQSDVADQKIKEQKIEAHTQSHSECAEYSQTPPTCIKQVSNFQKIQPLENPEKRNAPLNHEDAGHNEYAATPYNLCNHSNAQKNSTPSAAVVPFTASTKIVGPALLLAKVAQDTGLTQILQQIFPDFFDKLLSIVFFIVQKGLPLSRCESWSKNNAHPFQQCLTSQRISELLQKITEESRQYFLKCWLQKIVETDYLCYDITSISSYSEANEFVRFGYNRDHESLPQINLAMLFGQKSKLPAYYRRIPGNISDVATLETTMQFLDFLGVKNITFVLDRGFFSQDNLRKIQEKNHQFIIGVPNNRKWVQNILDQHSDSITSPTKYVKINEDEALFAAVHEVQFGGHTSYLHIFYNNKKAAEDFDNFTLDLLKYKEELEANNRQAKHQKEYEKFFFIDETDKMRVKFNEIAIQDYRKKYAGFFCILSTNKMDFREILRIYRNKEVVENCFDDLKNQLDMKRLRVHSSAAMDSRIFLQFLALIIMSHVRNVASEDKVLGGLTIREIMEALESLVEVRYPGGVIYTETDPKQRRIMEVFGLEALP